MLNKLATLEHISLRINNYQQNLNQLNSYLKTQIDLNSKTINKCQCLISKQFIELKQWFNVFRQELTSQLPLIFNQFLKIFRKISQLYQAKIDYLERKNTKLQDLDDKPVKKRKKTKSNRQSLGKYRVISEQSSLKILHQKDNKQLLFTPLQKVSDFNKEKESTKYRSSLINSTCRLRQNQIKTQKRKRLSIDNRLVQTRNNNNYVIKEQQIFHINKDKEQKPQRQLKVLEINSIDMTLMRDEKITELFGDDQSVENYQGILCEVSPILNKDCQKSPDHKKRDSLKETIKQKTKTNKYTSGSDNKIKINTDKSKEESNPSGSKLLDFRKNLYKNKGLVQWR